ncbi:MAG: helicase-related protein, partial [Terriglobia bacterium]
QGLREQFGVFGPSATWWMSATLQTDWLRTVDFDPAPLTLVELEDDDLATEEVRKIREARKPLHTTGAHMGDAEQLAEEIVATHKKTGGRTLVVVNTVTRARVLHAAVQRELKAAGLPIEPVLIHSRFRPPDRKEHVERLLEEPGEQGMLVISTQVAEAGVDVSARTLFTELAPWSSLVQRFGRCNRRGSDNYTAQAFWIDLPENENQQEKVSNPYELVDLKRSRELLRTCNDVSPASLEAICFTQPFQHTHVIRRHDLYGLFSTEPDLAGGFTDISAFVRDLDKDADVYVFWRDFAAKPQEDQPQPSRDELCHVPVWQLRDFLGKKGSAWEWDGENEGWSPRSARDIRPGMTLMLNFTQGGYAEDFGWTGRSEDKPEVLAPSPDKPDALNRDRQSETDWLSLADHLLDAEAAARTIADSLEWDRLPKDALVKAARWHDVGKLHGKWQDSVETYIKRVRDKIATYSATDLDGPVAVLLRSLEERCALPTTAEKPWAKFPDVRKAIRCSGLDDAIQAALTEALSGQFRPALRHEAASALAAWQHWRRKSDGWTALAIYLVAAHHGKVRTVLRSRLKGGGDVFGIRQGDKLPPLPGWLTETMPLVLECKAFGGTGEWGESGETFDLREPSWVGVVAELLGPEFPSDPLPSVLSEAESKHLGPLRLVFLEALTVAADVRASRQPGSGRNLCQKS